MKFILGTCQYEEEHSEKAAIAIKAISKEVGIENSEYYFKSSFDKANRTSLDSPRGVGIETWKSNMRHLTFNAGDDFYGPHLTNPFDDPIENAFYGWDGLVTDVHTEEQVKYLAKPVFYSRMKYSSPLVMQIPAMLSRQTDLLMAARRNSKQINVKMGQWMSPTDVDGILSKVGNDGSVWICYRGTSFGYNNLVVDFTSLQIIKDRNPDINLIFDATHSVQKPGGMGKTSGGNRALVAGLVNAAVAHGYIDGLFLETHPDPENAMSDGPNSVDLDQLRHIMHSASKLIKTNKEISDMMILSEKNQLNKMLAENGLEEL